MLGYTHTAIAIAIAKIFGLISLNSYFEIALLAFFAVIPDIDTPAALIGKIFFPVSRYIYKKFGHRNITHSLIFMIFSTLFFAFNFEIYLLVLIGYGFHLIADMLTYTGIPLFWPMNKNCIILDAPLLTGRWTEKFIAFVSVLAFVFMEIFL